ncbi:MAG: hypothetical protein WD266_05360 [Balneolales bacterium]
MIIQIMLPAMVFFQSIEEEGTGTGIGQISRPFAEITNQELIGFFLDQFLIAESDVNKLEIIDVTANGFGPDDIVVAHPSMSAYIVEEPSEAALTVMQDWSLDDYRVDSDNIEPDLFDPELTGNVTDAAQNAIIADLLRTLNRNYAGLPIRLRLERDENGFTFEMWDFDEGSLQYTPSPPVIPDSVLIYLTETDTVIQDRVLAGDQPDAADPESPPLPSDDHPDTGIVEPDPPAEPEPAPQRDLALQPLSVPPADTVITERNLYDVIYISKTVSDTVYLPEVRP